MISEILVSRQILLGYDQETIDAIGNVVFVALFGAFLVYFGVMLIKSRYWWFNTTFFFGFATIFVAYLGKVLEPVRENYDEIEIGYYLMYIICLFLGTIIVMAGIYFTFGELIVILGTKFSILPPMWYSYIFFAIDICSGAIQVVGGCIAIIDDESYIATIIMIVGAGIQLASMTFFVLFLIVFLFRAWFSYSWSQKNKRVEYEYSNDYLEIRQKRLFKAFPFAFTIAVLAVYTRCIFRVTDIALSWENYIRLHRYLVLVLDAGLLALCGAIFVPFHPYWVFGKDNVLTYSEVKPA